MATGIAAARFTDLIPQLFSFIYAGLVLDNYAATSSAMPSALFTPAQKMFDLAVCQAALKSCQVEAVKIHHLGPRRHKVMNELLPGIITSVNFR